MLYFLNVLNILPHFNILIEMPNSNTYISYMCKIAFLFILDGTFYKPLFLLSYLIEHCFIFRFALINNITCMQHIELIHVIKVLLIQKQYL